MAETVVTGVVLLDHKIVPDKGNSLVIFVGGKHLEYRPFDKDNVAPDIAEQIQQALLKEGIDAPLIAISEVIEGLIQWPS